jgi:hypothetical protein
MHLTEQLELLKDYNTYQVEKYKYEMMRFIYKLNLKIKLLGEQNENLF